MQFSYNTIGFKICYSAKLKHSFISQPQYPIFSSLKNKFTVNSLIILKKNENHSEYPGVRNMNLSIYLAQFNLFSLNVMVEFTLYFMLAMAMGQCIKLNLTFTGHSRVNFAFHRGWSDWKQYRIVKQSHEEIGDKPCQIKRPKGALWPFYKVEAVRKGELNSTQVWGFLIISLLWWKFGCGSCA